MVSPVILPPPVTTNPLLTVKPPPIFPPPTTVNLDVTVVVPIPTPLATVLIPVVFAFQ